MATENFSWTCPYCNQVTTITAEDTSYNEHKFNLGNKHGPLAVATHVIVCPNSACKEVTLRAFLLNARQEQRMIYVADNTPIDEWALKPQSVAKPFPTYIPAAILHDYREACLILDLSPKASATLSRRCLQGMIRDFWGITEPRLLDEVNQLKGKVDNPTWSAIDAVRSIGNIGAHMEKDINVILDVEPKEAELLIRLIEELLKEWYIHKHDRDEHMRGVVDAAEAKKASKGSNP